LHEPESAIIVLFNILASKARQKLVTPLKEQYPDETIKNNGTGLSINYNFF
jgi:hypothetical protein